MNSKSKWGIFFKPRPSDEFKALSEIAQKRIAGKMRFFVSTGNLLRFAKPLKDKKLGDFRFRVGDYRIIFNVSSKGRKIIVLKVAKRDEIYK